MFDPDALTLGQAMSQPVTSRPRLEQGSYLRLDTGRATPLGEQSESVLICGSAIDGLDIIADRSVRTVVTSPPYWSLRDYNTVGQIGRDDTLYDYVKSIVTTFDKVRRVLADDGTVWLNIGDSYTSGNRRYRAPDRKNRARAMRTRPATPEGLKPKDLIGVPWRLAFALQDAGWWVRSEVIWYKPNAHPESVRDRPTKAHESVFLLSKSKDYYDVSAVRGPNGRRLRTLWEINTEPRRREAGGVEDHPAVMPMTAGPSVHTPHQSARGHRSRPLCGLRHHAARRKGTRPALGRYRAEPVLRSSHRTPPSPVSNREALNLKVCQVHAEWVLKDR